MRGSCQSCGGLLFPRYGDGDRLCAACRERKAEELPAAVEPQPGQAWQPVRGTVGGTAFGVAPVPPGGPLTPWWLRPVEDARQAEPNGEAPTLGRAGERECGACEWRGTEGETVHRPHSPADLLCPICHEPTEAADG